MRLSRIGAPVWKGRRKWVTLAVAVLLAAWAVSAAAGRDIRLWWILRGLDDEPEAAAREIRALGPGYREALGRAILRGGRSLEAQLRLSLIAYGEPFYGRDLLRRALRSEEPSVRRSAAQAFLRMGYSVPPGPIPDDVLAVLRDWAREPAAPRLAEALSDAGRYRDPRMADVLAEVLLTDYQPEDENELARLLDNRQTAARACRPYVGEAKVREALRTVLRREKESGMVRMYAVRSLAGGGAADALDVFEAASRDSNPFVRQALAENLREVKDPRVIPILTRLLEDPKETVRRGAVDTLIAKRAPVLMERIRYLAEDSFSSIKGDLAEAVDVYRRKDLVPFLAWCLSDPDPIVVEKALVALVRLTRRHYGFTDAQWNAYRWPKKAGDRSRVVQAFMNDEARRREAVDRWVAEFPPRYTDRDRLPHLVKQLGHADPENVRRAIRELVKITGRAEGFPPAVLDRGAKPEEEADALYRFMHGGREKIIEEWTRRLKAH